MAEDLELIEPDWTEGKTSDRYRDVCFTCYNVSDENRARLLSLECQYIVFQLEKCPTTGREHFQGFIQLRKQMRFNAVRALDLGHIGRRRGTPTQAAAYCKKLKSRVAGHWESGLIRDECGKRTDIEAVKEAVTLGKRGRELWEDHFGTMMRYHKAVDRFISLCSTPRSWKTEVFVFWGDAGSGKSRRAFDTAPAAYVHDGSQWFDGYCDHEDVIIDDYTGSIQLDVFLKLLDRYPMQVPIKGGYVNWVPKRLFITSNLQPVDWYPRATAQQHAAIRRRLDTVEFMGRAPDFGAAGASAGTPGSPGGPY